MTFHNGATGGVTTRLLRDLVPVRHIRERGPPAIDGWIDILSPLRYFVANYVVPSGGAPADPLDIPIWQIIEGWEMASSDYAPVQFTHSDSRLEMD